MSRNIPAIFDAGVFRPLEPVDLADGTEVVLQVQGAPQTIFEAVDKETREAWNDYLDQMEFLPDHSPRNGQTNRDHDRIIYGG